MRACVWCVVWCVCVCVHMSVAIRFRLFCRCYSFSLIAQVSGYKTLKEYVNQELVSKWNGFRFALEENNADKEFEPLFSPMDVWELVRSLQRKQQPESVWVDTMESEFEFVQRRNCDWLQAKQLYRYLQGTPPANPDPELNLKPNPNAKPQTLKPTLYPNPNNPKSNPQGCPPSQVHGCRDLR